MGEAYILGGYFLTISSKIPLTSQADTWTQGYFKIKEKNILEWVLNL